jgi:hypothetical protein
MLFGLFSALGQAFALRRPDQTMQARFEPRPYDHGATD